MILRLGARDNPKIVINNGYLTTHNYSTTQAFIILYDNSSHFTALRTILAGCANERESNQVHQSNLLLSSQHINVV